MQPRVMIQREAQVAPVGRVCRLVVLNLTACGKWQGVKGIVERVKCEMLVFRPVKGISGANVFQQGREFPPLEGRQRPRLQCFLFRKLIHSCVHEPRGPE